MKDLLVFFNNSIILRKVLFLYYNKTYYNSIINKVNNINFLKRSYLN